MNNVPETDGALFTVTAYVLKQPPVDVYVIIAVPAVTPVTTPDAETVAVAVLPLAHVPPAGELANVMLAPSHTFEGPIMSAGAAFTVTTLVRKQPAP
jgi:hypothetical protein